jgi:hypothetical protein
MRRDEAEFREELELLYREFYCDLCAYVVNELIYTTIDT